MYDQCRCDCVNCVTGNHQGCYYWPVDLCCPFPRTHFGEATASEGLDLDGYHFKWKQAKEYELISPRTDDTRLLPYWERVRLTFLELGGELKSRRRV